MSFTLSPSVFLGLNVVILLCATGNSNLLVSSEERGKVGNVSKKTSQIGDLFLAHPFTIQHHHADSRGDIKDSSEILSDDPSPIDVNELRRELEMAIENFAKEKREFADKKSKHEKAREDFESRKKEDEKELAKMEDIKKERKNLEENLEKLVREEEELRETLNREEEELKEEEKKVEAEERKHEDLRKRKEMLQKKKKEVNDLSEKLGEQEKAVKDKLGDCTEVPEELKQKWGNDFHPEMRLCSRKIS